MEPAADLARPTPHGKVLGSLSANPGDAVYGAIAVGALLAAESARRETYPRTIAAVAITMVLYWLAHSYADLAGQRLRSGAHLTAGRIQATIVHELPILIGAAVPLASLLVCWAAGVKLPHGVIAGIWTSAAIVAAIEIVAGLRGDLTGGRLLSQALMGALLGSLILVLKVVLH
jgi:hypothetical protein